MHHRFVLESQRWYISVWTEKPCSKNHSLWHFSLCTGGYPEIVMAAKHKVTESKINNFIIYIFTRASLMNFHCITS